MPIMNDETRTKMRLNFVFLLSESGLGAAVELSSSWHQEHTARLSREDVLDQPRSRAPLVASGFALHPQAVVLVLVPWATVWGTSCCAPIPGRGEGKETPHLSF